VKAAFIPGTALIVCEVTTPDNRRACMRLLVEEFTWDHDAVFRHVITERLRHELSDFMGYEVEPPVRAIRQIRRGNEIEWGDCG
jgi:hypothetical protein